MKEFSNKRPYLRPQLTVVDFRVERGFAGSEVELPTLGTMELGVIDGLNMRMGGQMSDLGVGNGGSDYFGYVGTEGSSGFFSEGTYF